VAPTTTARRTSSRSAATTRKRKPVAAKQAAGAKKATGSARRVAGAPKPNAAGATKRVAEAVKPTAIPGASGLARRAAQKALKAMARGAVQASAAALRAAVDRAAQTGRDVVDSGLSRRLPIQVSIDVAVPLNVAWDEWMTFESMTEGVPRIEDVERDGDYLFGKTAPRSEDWEAEIVDERQHESFAWRSVQGSDCAGLATFHRLSDRLTRIELNLDVLPTNPAETFALALHLAHHRAEVELRRFKARVEFISPDVYETDDDSEEPESDEEA
jgi:uncharacterized membrane protein